MSSPSTTLPSLSLSTQIRTYSLAFTTQTTATPWMIICVQQPIEKRKREITIICDSERRFRRFLSLHKYELIRLHLQHRQQQHHGWLAFVCGNQSWSVSGKLLLSVIRNVVFVAVPVACHVPRVIPVTVYPSPKIIFPVASRMLATNWSLTATALYANTVHLITILLRLVPAIVDEVWYQPWMYFRLEQHIVAFRIQVALYEAGYPVLLLSDEVSIKIQTCEYFIANIFWQKYFGTLNWWGGRGRRRRLIFHNGQRSLMINVCIINL